jgi:hypothetical protein
MNVRRMQILTSVLSGLLALVGSLVLLGERDGGPGMVYAQSGTGAIRVAITGTDAITCGGVVTPCRTVQYAVDQALPGEKVLVAQGIYTGVSVRAGITQVVYISKPVSIHGGYTIADGFAGPPDLTAYPTTLDAGGLGRVLYITGTNALTIEGLRLTLGNAVAGEGPNADGGGAAIINTPATIRDCWVFANVADSGAGLCLAGSNADLRGNLISTNSAVSAGGGLGISAGSEAKLSGNVIISNTAGWGGGLDLNSGTATLINNFIVEN